MIPLSNRTRACLYDILVIFTLFKYSFVRENIDIIIAVIILPTAQFPYIIFQFRSSKKYPAKKINKNVKILAVFKNKEILAMRYIIRSYDFRKTIATSRYILLKQASIKERFYLLNVLQEYCVFFSSLNLIKRFIRNCTVINREQITRSNQTHAARTGKS